MLANASIKEDVTVYHGNEDGICWENIAAQLSTWTDEEAHLLHQDPQRVMAQLQTGFNIVLIQGETLIGYAALYLLATIASTPHWELGTVVVNKQYRGNGWSEQLYNEIEALHDRVGGLLYGTTKSPQVVRIGLRHGLNLDQFDNLPHDTRVALCFEAACYTPVTADANAPCIRQYDRSRPQEPVCTLRCRHPCQ